MIADITQELKEIREGQFGEDIRWPIYFALANWQGQKVSISLLMTSKITWYPPKVPTLQQRSDV